MTNPAIQENLSSSERLIVALDFDTEEQALELVNSLGDSVSFYKVGWQMFLGTGWSLVRSLLGQGKKVFLDLKMNDIEATVRAAIANIPKEFAGGIELLTIHGNGSTVSAAKQGRNTNNKPYLLMITVLSSMDDADVKDIISNSEANVSRSALACLNAEKALDAGCEGLIASGEAVKDIRDKFGKDFLIVSPGIRLGGSASDDHKNTLTPYEAIMSGSDYLVVGRPITRSGNPKEAADGIVSDINEALSDLQQVRI